MADSRNYDEVYGSPFSNYSSKEFEQFLEPFRIRLQRNGIDANSIFEGRDVLDAGCGGGRGSVLIARSSPKSLCSVDISPLNVEATRRRLDGEISDEQATVLEANLAEIPLEDSSVDTIWFSGVLQHTENPSRVLLELNRVLRDGGQMFIYVYGAGGVYWRIIDAIRQGLHKTSSESIQSALSAIGISNDRIAEFLDDWKVDYLRCYERRKFEEILEAVGFSPVFLPKGTDYDTSAQRSAGIPEDLVGEGDLRFLATKSSQPVGLNNAQEQYLDVNDMRANRFPLLDSSLESLFSSFLETLAEGIRGNPDKSIGEVANLQLRLRDEFLHHPNYRWLGDIVGRQLR